MPRVSTTSSGAFDRCSGEFKGLEYLSHLFDSCSEYEDKQKICRSMNILKKPLVSCPDSIRVRDWSTLPRDISRLIADKIKFFPHLQIFCLACKEWSEITKIVPDMINNQPPLLLLPYNKETQTCTFLELEHSKTYDLKMPELQDHWICGSSNGWLAMINKNMELSLLNPLTRARIKLPPVDPSAFPFADVGFRISSEDYKRTFIISRVVLSDDPSSSECLVAIIYAYYGILGVCRLGDANWTVENYSYQLRDYDDVIFYRGKIITCKQHSFVLVLDFDGESGLSIPRRIPANMWQARGYQLKSHLAVSCGQLFLILRFTKRKIFNANRERDKMKRRPYKTYMFEVYKLKEDTNSWDRVYSLGEQCLFLGPNDSIFVEIKEFPWCKPNCIYFTNDNAPYTAGHKGYQWDNGIFSLAENSVIEKLDIRHSLSFWPSPAIWFRPKII